MNNFQKSTWQSIFAAILCFTCVFLVAMLLQKEITANTSIQLNLIDEKSDFENKFYQSGDTTKWKKRVHVPKFMLELYRQNNNNPDIVRSLIPISSSSSKEVLNSDILIFNLPTMKDDEEFVGAQLKILTLIDLDPKLFIGIQRHLNLYIFDNMDYQLLHELEINHTNNTWITFDLTVALKKILTNNPNLSELKILITVSDFYVNFTKSQSFKLSLLPKIENFEHDYPVLLLSYTSINSNNNSKKSRNRRNIEDDYEEETNKIYESNELLQNKAQIRKLKRLRNTCRKRHLYVDFSEIQYDSWIVQPSGYEAYQCTGKCFYPVAEHLSPTKHAIVQSLLHSVSPSTAVRSCCVPTKLNSISLLYIDDKGVLTYRYGYNDMVVEECGCR